MGNIRENFSNEVQGRVKIVSFKLKIVVKLSDHFLFKPIFLT